MENLNFFSSISTVSVFISEYYLNTLIPRVNVVFVFVLALFTISLLYRCSIEFRLLYNIAHANETYVLSFPSFLFLFPSNPQHVKKLLDNIYHPNIKIKLFSAKK